MKSSSIIFLLSVLFLLPVPAFGQIEPAELEKLYQSRRYFELREAVAGSKNERAAEILFYRAAVANKFNEPEKSVRLLQKFIKSKPADRKKLAEAYVLLADNYTKTFEYRKAADAYQTLLDEFKDDITREEADSYKNVHGLWSALKDAAPQRVTVARDMTIAGTRDKARLLNVAVEANGQKMDFIFDTGANLSTMTASTAARLGLKIIEADVSVGSSTDKNVRTKLAVAPRLRIGDALIENAVFLVMEDKALYVPPIDYQINAIIGFPVIKALGRLTLTRDDKIMVAAKTRTERAEPNMALEGLLPLVAGTYNGRRMIFSFDTGATASQLYVPFYEAETEAIKKQSDPQKVKFGGAGGALEITAYKLKDFRLEIGGQTALIPEITVATEKFNRHSGYYYGNLGQDLIKQFEKMTLDFEAMRLIFE
jgi:predicted aspartyl protease